MKKCSYQLIDACKLLWNSYRGCSIAQRSLSAARPLIAPFDRIVDHIPSGARVLDIGCGNGLLLVLLNHYAGIRSGVGVDINPAAVAAAHEMASACSLPLSFRTISGERDLPPEVFNVVVISDVLHHVPVGLRQSLMSAAMERVAPGGCLIYKDMCQRPSVRRWWNQLHDLLLTREIVRVEPIEHVIAWVSRSGFAREISERYVGVVLYGHELEIFRCPLPKSDISEWKKVSPA